jgi:hypothetical protein
MSLCGIPLVPCLQSGLWPTLLLFPGQIDSFAEKLLFRMLPLCYDLEVVLGLLPLLLLVMIRPWVTPWIRCYVTNPHSPLHL